MRIIKTVSCILVAASFAPRAFALDEGDKVVVVAERAALRSVVDTTGSVTKGAILVVRNIEGDWCWVYWSNGSETVKGWIHRDDVVPYSEAMNFFDKQLKRSPTATLYSQR